MRCESWMTSSPCTSTGTQRCPVNSSISGRSRFRKGTRTSSNSMPARAAGARPCRSGRPGRWGPCSGTAWPRATPAAGSADRVLRGADRRAREAVLDLLGAPRARDPVVLALEVPGDRGLERLLVRARPPARARARPWSSGRSTLLAAAHLERCERPAAPAGGEQACRRRGGGPGSLTGGSTPDSRPRSANRRSKVKLRPPRM